MTDRNMTQTPPVKGAEIVYPIFRRTLQLTLLIHSKTSDTKGVCEADGVPFYIDSQLLFIGRIAVSPYFWWCCYMAYFVLQKRRSSLAVGMWGCGDVGMAEPEVASSRCLCQVVTQAFSPSASHQPAKDTGTLVVRKGSDGEWQENDNSQHKKKLILF